MNGSKYDRFVCDSSSTMINNLRYPVVAVTSLEPARRRPFRGALRRDPDLPRQPPGTVLVLQAGERFVVAPPGRTGIDGRRASGASAAVVVSLRRHAVGADVDLPSPWPDTAFHVTATYSCLVTDAALLLQFGCWELGPYLWRHLADDPVLRTFAADADPGARELSRLRLHAHAVARNVLSPPFVPGMTCDLVRLSTELRVGAGSARSGPDPTVDRPDRYPEEAAGPAPQDYVWDG